MQDNRTTTENWRKDQTFKLLLPYDLEQGSANCFCQGPDLFSNVSHLWGFPGGTVVKNVPDKRPNVPWVRKIPWKRKWQSTSVFSPGKSNGQRSLAGYSLYGHKESYMTWRLSEHTRRHGPLMAPAATAQPSHCCAKAATDNMQMNGHGCSNKTLITKINIGLDLAC